MVINVIKGSDTIGGCVVSIKSKETNIIIDFGKDLVNDNEFELEGLTKGESSFDAVFFTHSHSDHVGLMKTINEDIDLYTGELSKEIMIIQEEKKISDEQYLGKIKGNKPSEKITIKDVKYLHRIKTYESLKKIVIKDISITPIINDHSAIDSYMFIIEAEGKKILHTGDFRLHGSDGNNVIKRITDNFDDIDLVITEGTLLTREDYKTKTSQDLRDEAKELYKKYKYMFVVTPTTNFPRHKEFNDEIKIGRYFIVDRYQKKLYNKVNEYHPDTFYKSHIYRNDIKERYEKRGFIMMIRYNEYFKPILEEYRNNNDAVIIYSMWSGYLKENEGMRKFVGDSFETLHISGHVTKEGIEELINAINPKVGVKAIHTEDKNGLSKLNINSKVILEDIIEI